jgi:hypothetical protein
MAFIIMGRATFTLALKKEREKRVDERVVKIAPNLCLLLPLLTHLIVRG